VLIREGIARIVEESGGTVVAKVADGDSFVAALEARRSAAAIGRTPSRKKSISWSSSTLRKSSRSAILKPRPSVGSLLSVISTITRRTTGGRRRQRPISKPHTSWDSAYAVRVRQTLPGETRRQNVGPLHGQGGLVDRHGRIAG
jgi:hypothetical protein